MLRAAFAPLAFLRMNAKCAKFFAAVCAIAAAALAGCSSAPKFGENVYPMGAILPLTGENAAAAREALNGMELGAEKVNASGGIAGLKVEIVPRDANGSGKLSFEENFDALRRDGVRVISVGFDEVVVPWHRRIAKCDDAFVNFLCQYPPATVDAPNSVRIFLNGAQDGDVLSKAVERSGRRDTRIVLMSVDSMFGKACGDYLAFCVRLEHTKLYADVFTQGTRDFSIFSGQIKRLFPDCVFYVGRGGELKSFVESVAKDGFRGTVASGAVFGFEPFKVPDGVKFFRTATLFELGKISTPASREFVAAYRAKYGKAPTWVAAYGYDSVVELAKAVEAAKFNPSKMRDYFKDRKTEGAIGSMEFDRTADPLSDLELTRL